jgi:hypothetical protein
MKFANKSSLRARAGMAFLGPLLPFLMQPQAAHADQVRHLFDSQTSPLSLQTEGACGALFFHPQSWRCNPALLRELKKNSATMELTSLADEPTFRSLWKFVKEPLTAADVQRLFTKQSFATFSGYGRIQTASKWLSLEYTPLSLSGAYRITNPSLPLIQAAGIQKSVVAVTSSLATADFFPALPVNISMGTQLRYVDGVQAQVEIDAITASATGSKNVTVKKDLKKFNADVGISMKAENPIIPQLGIVLQNTLSDSAPASTDATLQADETEHSKSAAHAAWAFTPKVGTLWVSGALFWDGVFSQYRWEKVATSLGYNIGTFTVSAAFSPARFGWGFQVQRGYYHIAMQYAQEKQPAYFQFEYQQKLYLSVGVAL